MEVAEARPMAFYRLTHIDDQALPVRLSVNAIDFLVTAGSLHLRPPNEMTRALNADGMLYWDMRGYRLPETRVDRVMSDTECYRRVGSDRIEFPVDFDNRPPEYTVDVTDDGMVMSTRPEVDREYSALQLFGGHRSWQFTAAPSEDPGPRSDHNKSQVIAVGVEFRGREIRWLSRLMSSVLIPIMNWNAERRFRRGGT